MHLRWAAFWLIDSMTNPFGLTRCECAHNNVIKNKLSDFLFVAFIQIVCRLLSFVSRCLDARLSIKSMLLTANMTIRQCILVCVWTFKLRSMTVKKKDVSVCAPPSLIDFSRILPFFNKFDVCGLRFFVLSDEQFHRFHWNWNRTKRHCRMKEMCSWNFRSPAIDIHESRFRCRPERIWWHRSLDSITPIVHVTDREQCDTMNEHRLHSSRAKFWNRKRKMNLIFAEATQFALDERASATSRHLNAKRKISTSKSTKSIFIY